MLFSILIDVCISLTLYLYVAPASPSPSLRGLSLWWCLSSLTSSLDDGACVRVWVPACLCANLCGAGEEEVDCVAKHLLAHTGLWCLCVRERETGKSESGIQAETRRTESFGRRYGEKILTLWCSFSLALSLSLCVSVTDVCPTMRGAPTDGKEGTAGAAHFLVFLSIR